MFKLKSTSNDKLIDKYVNFEIETNQNNEDEFEFNYEKEEEKEAQCDSDEQEDYYMNYNRKEIVDNRTEFDYSFETNEQEEEEDQLFKDNNQYNENYSSYFSKNNNKSLNLNARAKTQLNSTKKQPFNSFNLNSNVSNNNYNYNSTNSTHSEFNMFNNRLNFVNNDNKHVHTNSLVPVTEIPEPYRAIFKSFPYFNLVQSHVFNDVFYTNENVVISAPTSSGKTCILEMAIVSFLCKIGYDPNNISSNNNKKFKIVYMAPLKALCNEKFTEWKKKFETHLKLKCIEYTGDSVDENLKLVFSDLNTANIICTTPEKWDLMTRKYKNNSQTMMESIKLFLIDEIHVLSEFSRGSTIEAVVSRMKSLSYDIQQQKSSIRFIAVSATIPNIEDFSQWLSGDIECTNPAISYKMDESYRPVKLEKIVLGYYCAPKTTDYMFDLSLSYKVGDVIRRYSDSKPSLIFCSTRKNTQQSAQLLANEKKYFINAQHSNYLKEYSTKLSDSKLASLIYSNGIGYHHAGMDTNDRHLIENLFLNGNLFVLFCTSTLSIGVNLPAHLVIIKSTMSYSQNQSYIEYTTTQINQMIGRAGRPQFDDSARAVIMTKEKTKKLYQDLLNDDCKIESNLHHELIEHLNVEIVLQTITDMKSAINWLKSTFMYIRLMKNPRHYGLIESNKNQINEKTINDYLYKLLIENVQKLIKSNLIEECDDIFRDDAKLIANSSGILMAKYCIAFETMKNIVESFKYEKKEEKNNQNVLYQSHISLENLIYLLSNSKEFEDIKLRSNEKAILNKLNYDGKMPKNKDLIMQLANDPNLIRYRQEGKIKNSIMKTNVLIQASLGCIQINDFSLNQDVSRILRASQRISKCMIEYLFKCEQQLRGDDNRIYQVNRNYATFINTIMVYKSICARMWYDSSFVFKQFTGIGQTLSQLLIDSNLKTFDDIIEAGPRRIEQILKKPAPFGNRLLNTIEHLPRFSIKFKKCDDNNLEKSWVQVECFLTNYENLIEQGCSLENSSQIVFILGDEKDQLLASQKLTVNTFVKSVDNGSWKKRYNLSLKENGSTIHASLVSSNFVFPTDSNNSDLDLYDNDDLNKKEEEQIEIEKDNMNNQQVSKSKIKTNSKRTNLKRLLSIESTTNNDNDSEITEVNKNHVNYNGKKSKNATTLNRDFNNENIIKSYSKPDAYQKHVTEIQPRKSKKQDPFEAFQDTFKKFKAETNIKFNPLTGILDDDHPNNSKKNQIFDNKTRFESNSFLSNNDKEKLDMRQFKDSLQIKSKSSLSERKFTLKIMPPSNVQNLDKNNNKMTNNNSIDDNDENMPFKYVSTNTNNKKINYSELFSNDFCYKQLDHTNKSLNDKNTESLYNSNILISSRNQKSEIKSSHDQAIALKSSSNKKSQENEALSSKIYSPATNNENQHSNQNKLIEIDDYLNKTNKDSCSKHLENKPPIRIKNLPKGTYLMRIYDDVFSSSC